MMDDPKLINLKEKSRVQQYVFLAIGLIWLYLMVKDSTWTGNNNLHVVMEIVATLLATIVGVLALIRYYTKRSNTILFVGSGFLGTAFLDFYHAVVTSPWFSILIPSPSTSILPWSWLSSRLFLSIMMCVSYLAWLREEKLGEKGRIKDRTAYIIVTIFTLVSFLFFVFFPLPRAYYPELFFGRPEEFIPGIFFFFALVGFLKKKMWSYDDFEHWVVLSLIVGVIGEVVFMSLSFRLFDTMFDVAHLLKKMSYILTMIGLLIAMYATFREAEESKVKIEDALKLAEGERQETQKALEKAEEHRIETESAYAVAKENQEKLKNKTDELTQSNEDLKEIQKASYNLLEDLNEEREQLQNAKDVMEKTNKELKIQSKALEDQKYALDQHSIVAITNVKGIITYANNKFCEISKYSREELIGQDHRIVNSGYHTKKFIENLWKTIANGKVWKGDIRNMAKDGTFYWVDTTIVPFLNEDNKPYQYLAIRTDITEPKNAEFKLTKQKMDLEKVNLELDSFVYTASHDLRAPLRGISSFASFLEEDYKDKLDEDGKKYVDRIRKGAERLSKLIDDLLTLSRISRIKNPFESVDINDLIKDIVERIEFDIEELNVDLVIQTKMPKVFCDRIKIGEVFLNLINNGIKFSSKNEKNAPKVEVGCEESEDCYEFFVKDNGIGIDKEYHQQVFGIFKRLHKESEFEGTGAGLSIVQRIVNDHQGKAWVESEIGHGATFKFTIPKDIKTPKKIGEILVEDGLISKDQLDDELKKQE